MMYAETLGDAFINPQALGECLHIQGCLLIQNVYTYRMSTHTECFTHTGRMFTQKLATGKHLIYLSEKR